ncbi:MAG: glycosyl hydrolase, partial [Verrucomicrobia bacterium]|nr:glycosyl hydrolase [Verrucomicrobiota bacterium]NDD39665.1 glycosyl hydrolase [Verrucomicrobiota bacterium]NDE99709.1 glycosyl hydrolase [Verrucomicrobiota bacterium]
MLMKKILFVLFAVFPVAASAATGPVRVLYYDAAGTEQTAVGPLHAAMRDLGRDAIWFDYATGPTPGPDTLTRYDAFALRPKADGQPALLSPLKLPSGHALPVVKIQPESTPEQIRTAVLAGLSAARKADWEKFLAQREPEQREPRPTVANYEKRPEPITFQHPLSVKGSMERTQVPADMRLQLFAAEPDIAKPIFMAWDERGRLWVAETRDYPHDVKPDGMGNDSIKICEDTDGDG